ncbi:hypothetical protein C6P40_004293 [Pichia californica]|uniref:Carboxylic ester hydrolase n=1 Tax=Pichia californica TaxID=460514 RepID=A0A9P7BHT7_9ASCO|nr:hypothetical protein C6P40_004293 [[Candida] californica]
MGNTISIDENTEKYQVTIPNQGTLTGYTLKNLSNGNPTTHRFAKVPYALPIKERFQLPKSIPDDYDYTGDYKEMGLKCPQPVYESKELVYKKSESDENIQYANIWIPSSNKYKPKTGWPVLIYIHGGWLQYGDPNHDIFNIVESMDDENFKQKYILVTLGYRLNIFGFLTCKELLKENPLNSNMGFWDQREGIKWVYKYIKYFGGDPEKITISGLSAGSYSAFFQLAYELYNPDETQIIKQSIFFSNMIFTQPKSIEECQEQFDEIIEKLGIKDLSSSKKLSKLRSYDFKFFETFIPKLHLHTFRAVTDNHFISSTILKDIKSGKFSKLLKNKKVRIMHGEVDNEGYLYSLFNAPSSYDDLSVQIENYYPKSIVPTLLNVYKVKDNININDEKILEQLSEMFGKITGDGQVYASSRGFMNNIINGGFPESEYFRYRIGYRGEWLDKEMSPNVKVTHSYDQPIWFYTLRMGFNNEEKEKIDLFLKPFLDFLYFEKDIKDWDTNDIKKYRCC